MAGPDPGDIPSQEPPPSPPPPLTDLGVLLATWFGIGLLKPAPGTWGSLVAVFLGWGLWAAGGWPALAAGTVAVSIVGIWAAERFETVTGRPDAGPVVIDEVAGQWLALLGLALTASAITLEGAAAAFVLFRLFDIWKPGPIGWADRTLKGGLGVMADDWLAGIAAGLSLALLARLGGLS